MMVTSRGIIIRQAVKAISPQSRSATGVKCSVWMMMMIALTGSPDAGDEEESE